MHHKCVKSKSPDLRASVCLWCEGKAIAQDATEDLEQLGYSVACGICESCILQWRADSLRGTSWELRYAL